MRMQRYRAILSFFAISMLAPSGVLAQNTVAIASEIGIAPQALVIAGIHTNAASTILSRLEAAVELRQALALQRELADAAGAEITDCCTLLLAAPTDTAVLEELQAARAAHQSARGQIHARRSELFQVVTEGFHPAKIERLIVWRHGATRRVPPEFRAMQRTPEQWKTIEVAVRKERRAIRRSEDLASDYAQLLADVRSHPAVVEAANNLAFNLEAMNLVFAPQ